MEAQTDPFLSPRTDISWERYRLFSFLPYVSMYVCSCASSSCLIYDRLQCISERIRMEKIMKNMMVLEEGRYQAGDREG